MVSLSSVLCMHNVDDGAEDMQRAVSPIDTYTDDRGTMGR